MHIEYLLLAKDSAVDQETNTLSVFSIIEDLEIRPDAPKLRLPFQILCSVRRDQEVGEIDQTGTLRIEPPFGSATESKVPVKMQANHTRCRMRVGAVVPIEGPGIFRVIFTMDQDVRLKCETVINIRLPLPKAEVVGSSDTTEPANEAVG